MSSLEVVRFAVVVAFAVAGGTLLADRASRRTGALVLEGAVLGAACLLAHGVAVAAGGRHELAEWVRAIAVGLIPAVMLHTLAALPDGVLRTRARRLVAISGYCGAAVVGGVIWMARPNVPPAAVIAAGFGALAVGVPMAYGRYRRAPRADRQRLQWLALAGALVVEVAVIVAALRIVARWPPQPATVILASTLLVPASLTAWRTRFVAHVDRVLAHAITLAGLTTVVIGVYLLVVIGLGRPPDTGERGLLLLSMLAAGVAAILFVPARAWLTDAATRLVYGERQVADDALATFGSRLTRSLPLDELLLQLAELLHRSLTLCASEVWTGADGQLSRVASVPDRAPARLALSETTLPVAAHAGVCGRAWAEVWLPEALDGRDNDAPIRIVPVTNAGDLLGLVVLERPAGGNEFTDEEERVLTEVARQLGLALHNAALDSALQETLDQVRRQAGQLQESRARIVAAGDAERRKIERNLHDGAQQRLVALGVHLRLIEQVVSRDIEAATKMLDDARKETQETIQELRALAHGIYPPLLMDRGLPEALRAAAGRAAKPTRVEADQVGRYAQEVEAAVYFCCLEAMQNAGKHAGEGASVRVSVAQSGERLLFEVADDGVGFAQADAAGGAGFVNMADRIGAMGGDLTVESAPGSGTRITGVVPIHA